MKRIGKRRDVNYYLSILERYNITPERIPQMTDRQLRCRGIGERGLHLLREEFGFASYDDKLKYELEKVLTPILTKYRNIGVKKVKFIVEFIYLFIKTFN
jgi:hypothetical protein